VVFSISITATLKPEVTKGWQARCWSALRQSAYDSYVDGLQNLQREREQLLEMATLGDTLTLRREEREEIMKTILEWLFGPSFEIVPSDVSALALPPAEPGGFETLRPTSSAWNRVLHFGELVKFFHEAVEWENVLYFLYPYFWGPPDNWSAARQLAHPDPTRQAFLRAGSARVVLTIRPQFETAFAKLMETGAFSAELPPEHPYMSIAGEIESYARTNYPGIPPANPSGETDTHGAEKGILVAEWHEYTPTSGVDIAVSFNASPP
jgi:hypothetical protein